ncbi:MAG: LPS export ABC transporter permease LptF [Gallionellaceae bacterium]|jgi:lipopolysaccharide export system permease protein|nr:LPS export ABC transporter permease LptF [Gallionellaceae bacterium]
MPDYPQTPSQKSKPREGKNAPADALRGGIFHRALVREFASTGLLVFAVLFGIIVLSQIIKLLAQSANGLLAVDGVLVLMGFAALHYLPVLLSISLFMSVLLTLSRCYRDSEMIIWFTAGIGLTRWLRPVLAYALPGVGVIALLSLVLGPWGQTRMDEYKHQLSNRDDVAAAQPGVFRESSQSDRVFFIDNVDVGHNRVGNIFVHQALQDGRDGTMMAREGFQETAENGDRFLVLLNGTRYEGIPGQRDFRMISFDRYAMRIEAVEATTGQASLKSQTTAYLLQNLDSWSVAELEWRLGLPISAIILVLAAIPLSFVNPRVGRSLNLLVALAIYMIYNNLMSMTNAWVGQEKMDAITGMFGLHLLMAGVVALMFWRRMSVFSLRGWKR